MKAPWTPLFLMALTSSAIAEPVSIGTRRELFVDDLLLGNLQNTRLKLHHPQRLPKSDPPRPSGHYATVLKDGNRYRLYFRGDKIPGMHWRDGWGAYHENEITLYAESKDGYSWNEPDLGLMPIPSHPRGNVLLDVREDTFLVTHNFSPFLDTRPGVPPEERYKALGGGRYPPETWSNWKTPDERRNLREKYGPGGLYAFVSPDGLHWTRQGDDPILSETVGNYDSQNVGFWSDAEQLYVCYFRWSGSGLRGIRRSTSKDFRTWSDPVDMEANQPGEHLYTSGTHPYYRAPHIYIALPTRFQTNRGSITDVVFMSTRPGRTRFDRPFKEAFIRPGMGPGGWGNRSNYLAWHVVPTSRKEMSMYMYGGDHYVLRTDGFISIHAGFEQGEFLTKPILFAGRELEINYSTSAAGLMRVEIQDAESGMAVPGFSLEDSRRIYGDEIQRIVKWGDSTDVSKLAGTPVRLRFQLQEADLFSLKFNP